MTDCAVFVRNVSATVVPVGGNVAGWTYGVYNTWRQPVITPGDQLLFNYSRAFGAFHNVYRLSGKEAFDSCNFTGALFLGNGTVLLPPITKPAIYYFACRVANGIHCRLNQKVAINVTEG